MNLSLYFNFMSLASSTLVYKIDYKLDTNLYYNVLI